MPCTLLLFKAGAFLQVFFPRKNRFLNIPYTFLLFKAGAFVQFFFPRNLLLRQVLRRSVFLNSNCLNPSNKSTHIPLFINQLVHLIELRMSQFINYWTNKCKLNIDKITYSNGSLEQRMTLVKINCWKEFIVS